MGNRFSLTISDLNGDEVRRITTAAQEITARDEPDAVPGAEEAAQPAKPKAARKTAPAALPANTSAPTAPAAPTPPAAAAPEPTAPPITAALTAVDTPKAPAETTGLTLDGLVAKARVLGNGPLKQMALVSVLRAMGAPSVNKIPTEQYPSFDALLDAATAYGGVPGASLDGLKDACAPGRYDDAIASLHGLAAASMGL